MHVGGGGGGGKEGERSWGLDMCAFSALVCSFL